MSPRLPAAAKRQRGHRRRPFEFTRSNCPPPSPCPCRQTHRHRARTQKATSIKIWGHFSHFLMYCKIWERVERNVSALFFVPDLEPTATSNILLTGWGRCGGLAEWPWDRRSKASQRSPNLRLRPSSRLIRGQFVSLLVETFGRRVQLHVRPVFVSLLLGEFCGEMPSKLWLIVANLQMHRPTLPPKGSAILAQSGRLRYISSDKHNSTHFENKRKETLNQAHHINRRLTNKLTKPGTFILL